MSELERGFESPPVVVGAIDTQRHLAWLEEDFWRCYEQVRLETDNWPTDQQVYERMRRQMFETASQSVAHEEIFTAALVFGGDYRRQYADPEQTPPPLRQSTREFYNGAAFAVAEIESWLGELDFDLEYYGHYMDHSLSQRVRHKPLSKIGEVRLGNQLYYDGLEAYAVYQPYWQPLLDRHRELFAVQAQPATQSSQAGVGYGIRLLNQAYAPFAAMCFNPGVTRKQSERLVRYFQRDLDDIESLMDLGWVEE